MARSILTSAYMRPTESVSEPPSTRTLAIKADSIGGRNTGLLDRGSVLCPCFGWCSPAALAREGKPVPVRARGAHNRRLGWAPRRAAQSVERRPTSSLRLSTPRSGSNLGLIQSRQLHVRRKRWYLVEGTDLDLQSLPCGGSSSAIFAGQKCFIG
jgi:hypothetical protein